MTSQAAHTTPHNVGIASDQGPTRPHNADAAAQHHWRDRLALAVVDGTGSTLDVESAEHAAYHGIRCAARRSPMLAILRHRRIRIRRTPPTTRKRQPDT